MLLLRGCLVALFLAPVFSGTLSLPSNAQSSCSVTGAMKKADGAIFINFSKARRHLVSSPKDACERALQGMRSGLLLTSNSQSQQLCLVSKEGGNCVNVVSALKPGSDANQVLTLIAGRAAGSMRLETSAHLYVRPQAGL